MERDVDLMRFSCVCTLATFKEKFHVCGGNYVYKGFFITKEKLLHKDT